MRLIQPSQHRDRQLPRPLGRPQSVNLPSRPNSQLRDRQLSRTLDCPPNVNPPSRPTNSSPKVNSAIPLLVLVTSMAVNFKVQLAVPPMSTRSLSQPHLGRPHDRHPLRPTSCPLSHFGHFHDCQLPRPTGWPPKVNSLPRPPNVNLSLNQPQPNVNSLPRPPNVNLSSSQPHLSRPHDRHLLRPTSYPLPHLGHPHDRQLPRPTGCPPKVNPLPRPPNVNLSSNQFQPNVNLLPRPPNVNLSPSQPHISQLSRPTGCSPKVNSLPRPPNVNLSSNQLQPNVNSLPRPPNVNLSLNQPQHNVNLLPRPPNVNLSTSQPHLGRPHDRHLLRPTNCPLSHLGHLHDRQLPRSTGCPPNVNSLPRPPNVNLSLSQPHLGRLRDRHLLSPNSCPPSHLSLLQNCQLPRSAGRPPNVNSLPRPPNVNQSLSQPHLGRPGDCHLLRPNSCPPSHLAHHHDRKLPCSAGRPPKVNLLPWPPNVNLSLNKPQPNVNMLSQTCPGQLRDRQPPMSVYSSGIQLYTGNYFSNDEVNRATRRYPLILLHLNY